MARWLNSSEMMAWRSLLHGSTHLLDALDREMRQHHDISLPDYEILSTLSEAPTGSLRMSELAERALLSASGLTYRVTKLEERGLTCRSACADDGRAVEATLTKAGRQLVEEAAPTHVAGVRSHLIDLVENAELEAMTKVLGAVLADLDKELT